LLAADLQSAARLLDCLWRNSAANPAGASRDLLRIVISEQRSPKARLNEHLTIGVS